MRVLALVSDRIQDRLAGSCAGDRIALEHITTLRPTLPEPDVLAIESRLDRPPASALTRFTRTYPHVGVLVIGPLVSELAQVAVALGQVRAVAVALEPYDTSGSLHRHLFEAYVGTIPARVVRELETVLTQLPEPTGGAVRRLLLTQPTHIRTVDDLAESLRLERRTVHRHFLKAGLPSPKEVLRAARLMRGLSSLYGREPFPAIAELLGYRRYTEFQIHVRRILGGSPRHVRYQVDPVELPAQIAAALLKAG